MFLLFTTPRLGVERDLRERRPSPSERAASLRGCSPEVRAE
jgi:hypothetical protein